MGGTNASFLSLYYALIAVFTHKGFAFRRAQFFPVGIALALIGKQMKFDEKIHRLDALSSTPESSGLPHWLKRCE